MPNLVPRQFRYIFRVAEFTVLTGLLGLFVSGRGQELTRLDTRWSWAILAGIILAIGVYALTRATIARWAYRLVEIGPLAASGDIPQPPRRCRSWARASAASGTSC
jgi:hypothetical protein